MFITKVNTIKKRLICLTVIIICSQIILAFANNHDQKFQSNHKVFIAFGFHVNLSHSFRNHSNNESGFGKDIRIIRRIIQTLDHFNDQGIPVKGIWDFDNLFSLQEILPQYAPDIITDIQRRVRENKDEVILMSYNNGIVSAMTSKELDDAVRWSITNPWQSGVKDIFGKFTPVVRPQEMMTTPGNFTVYKKHGIQAVSLYYSATPFDAFKVFSRPLSHVEAHNPVVYRHPQTKEEMVVIPTYHLGDLMEHVSLKHWVNELRNMQNNGHLNQDALIFINFDADSELWSGLDLPWTLAWMPNTGGLKDLIEEVKNLPNVEFTTLGDYLSNHPPVGTFFFSQDTADGSFNGYNSWAEKAETSDYWTVIERNRRTCMAAQKAMALLNDTIDTPRLKSLITFAEMTRLRALSTTNFGMATPFLAPQREQAVADLMNHLNGYSDQIEIVVERGLQHYLTRKKATLQEKESLKLLDTIMVIHSHAKQKNNNNRFLTLLQPKKYGPGMKLVLVRSDGKILPTITLDNSEDRNGASKLSLYVVNHQAFSDGIYHLCAFIGEKASHTIIEDGSNVDSAKISNDRLSISFENSTLEGIYLDDTRQVDTGSLLPYLKWKNKTYGAKAKIIQKSRTDDGRFVSVRIAGPLSGPLNHTISNGWMDYNFTLLDDLPYLVVKGTIQYPLTRENDILKAGVSELIRRTDSNWQEVAPLEVQLTSTAGKENPIRVLKQNYLDITSDYALNYFHHSDNNLNLDNVNNHITKSYVGMVAGNRGTAVAMDTSIQANFAFSPLKLRYDSNNRVFSVRANPFGTYHGRQYTQSTWGNKNGFDATLLLGEQFASAAPTYNGTKQHFSIMLAFFNGRQMPEKIKNDLMAYSHPPMVFSLRKNSKRGPENQPLPSPQGLVAAYHEGKVHFGWDVGTFDKSHYRIYCGLKPGQYQAVYPAVGNHLQVSRLTDVHPFIKGQRYYAAIERISAKGKSSQRSPEIEFTFAPQKEWVPKVPIKLEARILWANLFSLVDSL
jgi:hypothetical protein